ncbi:MAG: hypothetical protein QNJ22_24400 [Desulfosarcinaceae bacterium]|nr:hypothetical protein [Desulfosarcinaceae bacterium]
MQGSDARRPVCQRRYGADRGRGWLTYLVITCLLLSWQPSGAAPVLMETHRYTEITDDKRLEIGWRLEREKMHILTSTMADETSVCRIDDRFDTHQWQIQRWDQDTRLTAKRVAGEIHLTGTHKGLKVERTLKIDADPWYQAGSLSLRGFAQSRAAETRFWILRPGKYTAHKLIASRKGMDTLEIDGKPVHAHKIRVCLAGWKAPFWSATYWFREEDGLFLRYQGASGPPGSPETVVEWVPDFEG